MHRKSSKMASHKRLTADGDLGSAAQYRSKNFSSRRDLKELIFVDQRAFAINMDLPITQQQPNQEQTPQ